jgi:hypothetical protein
MVDQRRGDRLKGGYLFCPAGRDIPVDRQSRTIQNAKNQRLQALKQLPETAKAVQKKMKGDRNRLHPEEQRVQKRGRCGQMKMVCCRRVYIVTMRIVV